MEKYIEKFEKVVTQSLIILMAIVIVFALGDLAWLLVKDLISPPTLFLEVNELLEILGSFLLVMIAIELLETLRTYMHKKEIRTEIIILVALMALARKIVILDFKETSDKSLYGIAALIIALAISYYLIKRDLAKIGSEKTKGASHEAFHTNNEKMMGAYDG